MASSLFPFVSLCIKTVPRFCSWVGVLTGHVRARKNQDYILKTPHLRQAWTYSSAYQENKEKRKKEEKGFVFYWNPPIVRWSKLLRTSVYAFMALILTSSVCLLIVLKFWVFFFCFSLLSSFVINLMLLMIIFRQFCKRTPFYKILKNLLVQMFWVEIVARLVILRFLFNMLWRLISLCYEVERGAVLSYVLCDCISLLSSQLLLVIVSRNIITVIILGIMIISVKCYCLWKPHP